VELLISADYFPLILSIHTQEAQLPPPFFIINGGAIPSLASPVPGLPSFFFSLLQNRKLASLLRRGIVPFWSGFEYLAAPSPARVDSRPFSSLFTGWSSTPFSASFLFPACPFSSSRLLSQGTDSLRSDELTLFHRSLSCSLALASVLVMATGSILASLHKLVALPPGLFFFSRKGGFPSRGRLYVPHSLSSFGLYPAQAPFSSIDCSLFFALPRFFLRRSPSRFFFSPHDPGFVLQSSFLAT